MQVQASEVGLFQPRALAGEVDLLWVTFDTLRYDVAVEAMERGDTPNLRALLPGGHWERRHTPGSFTYAAHAAFFAGFLPTPTSPGPHPRHLALEFTGSETTTEDTWVLPGATVPEGLAELGYHTICVGGTGFFDPSSPLGRSFTSHFAESHFAPELRVTCPRSTEHQVALACARVEQVPRGRRVFVFVNVSAIHQPNRCYVDAAERDDLATHRAALAYVDSCLPPLVEAMLDRGRVWATLMSDHGTLYGEGGHLGHRVGHPTVWTVPYGQAIWSRP